jgi:hypothetical protein
MIVFTVLFTLPGRDPEENKYVEMAHMMLSLARLTGHADKIYIMADDLTWAAYKKIDPLWTEITRVTIPRPKTLLEGISYRYKFFVSVPDFDPAATYHYLDVDILPYKAFRLDLPADTIAVLPEGGREDPNYCGTAGWAQLDHAGLSAGFWAVRPGPDMLALFDEIYASVRRGPHNFYTCEQPHFNSCITNKTRAVYFEPSLVSFNGHGVTEHTRFYNLAGCPGDEGFHYDKMKTIYPALVSQMIRSHQVPAPQS